MLEDGILVHLLSKLFGIVSLWIKLENNVVHLFEAAQRVHWASIPLRSLEEIFSSRVHSLVWIFSRSTPAPSASWRVSKFTIRTLRVFLLHVSIESRVGQIGFVAVFALEVTALVIIFRPSLTLMSLLIALSTITILLRIDISHRILDFRFVVVHFLWYL